MRKTLSVHYLGDLETLGRIGESLSKAFERSHIVTVISDREESPFPVDYKEAKILIVDLDRFDRDAFIKDPTLFVAQIKEAHRNTPLIVLSAAFSNAENPETYADAQIKWLQQGVDEALYLNGSQLSPKIFGMRVKHLFQRAEKLQTAQEPSQNTIKSGNLVINKETFKIAYVDRPIDNLTHTEFNIIKKLASNLNVPQSRGELSDFDAITPTISEYSLPTHMKRIRAKLKASGVPDIISTVYGGGYVMTSEAVTKPLLPQKCAPPSCLNK